MRDIKKCVLFSPHMFEICQYGLGCSPCSHPKEEKCGSYVKIIQKEGKKVAITLCKHREKNREV